MKIGMEGMFKQPFLTLVLLSGRDFSLFYSLVRQILLDSNSNTAMAAFGGYSSYGSTASI